MLQPPGRHGRSLQATAARLADAPAAAACLRSGRLQLRQQARHRGSQAAWGGSKTQHPAAALALAQVLQLLALLILVMMVTMVMATTTKTRL